METRTDINKFLARSSQMLSETHHVGGVPATSGNQIQITAFYVAWLYLSSDLLSQNDVKGESFRARINNFVYALRGIDLLDILNICSDAVSLILSEDVKSYGGFKGLLTASHPDVKLIEGLLSPINLALDTFFVSYRCEAEMLKPILQFFRFGRKLNLKAIGLEEKALQAYVECEERLSAIDVCHDTELIDAMNKIMKRWLRGLDLGNLVPNHGSGSVAEGKLTLYNKYKALGVDAKLNVVLNNNVPSYYDCEHMRMQFSSHHPDDKFNDVVRVSRTVFVPKTYSKLRTISMEPATLQYWQQAIMKRLYQYIGRHSYLKWSIQLKDQEYNRRMARRGSKEDNLSTIDLSAASDTVSWTLVKRVFKGTPLLKWLYATRSDKTLLPDKRVMQLRKFAPMGSALCFPVQCLIFAAVIEYVTQRCTTATSEYPAFAVYGDDMIVGKAITPEVIEALESLGFIVNRDKSFVSGKFRESCGGDYYDGIDVSSLYFRFKADKTISPYTNPKRLSPEAYNAVCSVINLCSEHGYRRLRSYFLYLIRKYVPHFTARKDESPSIYSSQPTNFHAKARWHKDYQKWVARFCTVLSVPVKREDEGNDDIAYFVKLGQLAVRHKTIPQHDQDVSVVALHGTTVRLGRIEREVCLPIATQAE